MPQDQKKIQRIGAPAQAGPVQGRGCGVVLLSRRGPEQGVIREIPERYPRETSWTEAVSAFSFCHRFPPLSIADRPFFHQKSSIIERFR